MLSGRLLIIKRALLSANKITECRNELVDEYWPSKKRKTRSQGKARTSDALNSRSEQNVRWPGAYFCTGLFYISFKP